MSEQAAERDEALVEEGPALPGALLVVGASEEGLGRVALVAGLLGLDLPRDPRAGGLGEGDEATRDAWVSAAVAAALAPRPGVLDGVSAEELAHALDRGFGGATCPVIRAPGLARGIDGAVAALRRAGREPAVALVLGAPPPSGAGRQAWAARLLRLERDSRGLRRAVLRPDALAADWRAEAGRAGRALGIDWPTWGAAEATLDALSGPAARLPRDRTRDPDDATAAAAARLDRWSEAGEEPADHAVLDRLSEDLGSPGDPSGDDGSDGGPVAALVALASELDRSRQGRDSAEQARWRAEAELERLQGELRGRGDASDRRGETEPAAGPMVEATEVEALRAALARAEREVALLRAAPLEAIRDRLAALAPPADEGATASLPRPGATSDLLRRLREAEAEVVRLSGEGPGPSPDQRPAESKRRPQDEAKAVALRAEAERALARADAAESAERQARAEAAKASAQRDAATARADRLKESLRLAERRAAAAARELETMRASTSWRITGPLRSLVSRVRGG